MDLIDRLMRAAMISDDELVTMLNDLLNHDLRISIRALSEKSGIAQKSLYKIMHGRSPNLTTLRAIIHALRQLYHVGNEAFIGLSLPARSWKMLRNGSQRLTVTVCGCGNISCIIWRTQLLRMSGRSGGARLQLSALLW
ncbi:MAG: helix-turn-helix domain-containing protein, partial [Methanomicrobiales archaeon]